MENLEIKQILLQLEKQEKDIINITNGVSKIIKNNNANDIRDLNINTLKVVRQLFTHHKDAVKHMLALNEMLNQIKIFFNSFFSMLPIKTTQEFTFKGSIKWKIYLLSAFIGFIITLSSISYHNYKDNTDYEKAWKLLLKNNTTEKNKKYFNSILKTAENE